MADRRFLAEAPSPLELAKLPDSAAPAPEDPAEFLRLIEGPDPSLLPEGQRRAAESFLARKGGKIFRAAEVPGPRPGWRAALFVGGTPLCAVVAFPADRGAHGAVRLHVAKRGDSRLEACGTATLLSFGRESEVLYLRLPDLALKAVRLAHGEMFVDRSTDPPTLLSVGYRRLLCRWAPPAAYTAGDFFCPEPLFESAQQLDCCSPVGMAVDSEGRAWVGSPGSLAVFAPDLKLLARFGTRPGVKLAGARGAGAVLEAPGGRRAHATLPPAYAR